MRNFAPQNGNAASVIETCCGFPAFNGGSCSLPSGHSGLCLYHNDRRVPRPADNVLQPSHYEGTVAIETIRTALGLEGFVAYCRGNVIKYAYRAGKKSSTTALEDLRKAQQYIQWAIEACEK